MFNKLHLKKVSNNRCWSGTEFRLLVGVSHQEQVAAVSQQVQRLAGKGAFQDVVTGCHHEIERPLPIHVGHNRFEPAQVAVDVGQGRDAHASR